MEIRAHCKQARCNQDPVRFFAERFWNSRPDKIVINHEAKQRIFILQFRRSTARKKGFLKTADAESTNQHKSIMQALRAPVATDGEFEQKNFLVDNRRSVIESVFYAKLKELGIREKKKLEDKFLADYVNQTCEEHDHVIRSFQEQMRDSRGRSKTE